MVPGIEESKPANKTRKWIYICAIIALAAGMLGYRQLVQHNLQQSAALFIGLPALMGILLAFCPQPKSFTGIILKVICLGLCLSGPILGEGFLCILVAAPLFLVVGLLVGLVLDYVKKRKDRQRHNQLLMLLPLPFLLMSLEGTRPQWSFPREEIVSASENIQGTPDEVAARLSEIPDFETEKIPYAVRLIGFPLPIKCLGSGLAVGNERLIHFTGGEGKPGDLLLQVTESRPGFARFTVLKDTTHYRHWLNWKESQVTWSANADGTTSVRWTVLFERRLDPAWYFREQERQMTTWAARTLIQNCATPKK